MDIFDTLSKLSESSKRKEPCYIYRDEKDNQIKEVPLSKLDSEPISDINKLLPPVITRIKYSL